MGGGGDGDGDGDGATWMEEVGGVVVGWDSR